MTIAVVRALIPDIARYDRAADTGDGGTLQFLLPNHPAVAGSLSVYVGGTVQLAGWTLTAEQGLVTFAAAPTIAAAIVMTYSHTLLSDDTIQVYLTLEGDDRLAAADALDAIASNHALVEKVIRLGDLSVDGAKVADSLRKHASALRVQAVTAMDSGADACGFDVAEMVTDQFSYRERLYKEAERES